MMMTPHPRAQASLKPMLFLDFEASSLSSGSWPIEIGYAWFAEGHVQTRAMLIAPRADWSLTEWSPEAACVHGISSEDLHHAAPADAVAAETDVFAHFEVVSDNHAWDQRWLDRLRDGRPPIAVRPLRAAIRERLDDTQAGHVAAELFRSETPHRAGPDAARLAGAWLGAARPYGIAA